MSASRGLRRRPIRFAGWWRAAGLTALAALAVDCTQGYFEVIVRNRSAQKISDAYIVIDQARDHVGAIIPHTQAGIGYPGRLPPAVTLEWRIDGEWHEKEFVLGPHAPPQRELHAVVLVFQQSGELALEFERRLPGI